MLLNSADNTSIKIMNLGIIGLSPLERRLITSLCNLSQKRNTNQIDRKPCFKIVSIGEVINIDVYIADVDQHDIDSARNLIHTKNPNTSIVWVSAVASETDRSREYSLKRNRIGGNFLKLLDKIVENRDLEREKIKEPSSTCKTCLVVDDSEIIRTQMQIILDEFKLGVDFAGDAETAIRLVQNKSYDIIFLDVILPEMNGYKACKILKSNSNTKDIPVVMLTSKTMLFNKVHGAMVGCDVYLTKPTNSKEIHEVLQKYSILSQVS